MPDFCLQCHTQMMLDYKFLSPDKFFKKYGLKQPKLKHDFATGKPTLNAEGQVEYDVEFCDGCDINGPTLVDHEGRCVSPKCKSHSKPTESNSGIIW